MPREFLLYLLAAVVLLNVALLIGVALVRLREQPREASLDRRIPRPAARPSYRPAPRPAARGPLPGATRTPITRTAWDEGATARDRAPAPAAAIVRRPAEPPSAAAPVADPPRAPSSAIPEPVSPPAALVSRSAPASMRRPRRFVLPKLEEDRARAERAIQAVIGGPSTDAGIDGAAAHRPRRRSRRQRPAGSVPHTAVDLSLRGLDGLREAVGVETAGRLAAAVASTVNAHVRSGDRTIDLGDGRFRLIVEADPAGAEAAVDRMRALTAAWLAASVVPVALRASVVEPADPSPAVGGGAAVIPADGASARENAAAS